MKIVHLLFSFNNGGIENLIVDILNNWNKKDEVYLVIINDNVDKELIAKIKKVKNIKIIYLERKPGGKKFNTLFKLGQLLGDIQPNVIHCHNNNAFKFLMPLKLLNPKVKVFLTVHDTNIYNKFSKIDVLFNQIFLTKIIAISESVKKDIISKGINDKQIEIVYNGIDENKFDVIKGNKEKDKKIIISVARIIPQKKGQDILIHAIDILKEKRSDFKCILVGAAPIEQPEYAVEIENLIKDLKLEKYIEMLGNRNDVPELLFLSDIFVLPSRYEGFGISIIEAMMTKIPVIASKIDGPKEIIGNNDYGYLFDVENCEQLAKYIDDCLSSDNKELVNKAYSYAVNKFSINSTIRNLEKIYNG